MYSSDLAYTGIYILFQILGYWKIVHFLVLHSRSLLIICFTHNSTYVLLLTSYFIPSQPFPPGKHKFLFEVCGSISVLQVSSFILDFTYTWYHMISVWPNSRSMIIPRPIHCCCKWRYFIHFYGWVIFHCIYVSHLDPVICWWTLRCLSCLG